MLSPELLAMIGGSAILPYVAEAAASWARRHWHAPSQCRRTKLARTHD